MSDEPKPVAERSYDVRDVSTCAHVANGRNLSWVIGVAGLPGRPARPQQFAALLEPIAEETSLDEGARGLAEEKIWAVAEGLVKVQESPGPRRRALLDAKSWFGGAASWVGQALGDILKNEAAQKTIGTLTEAGTKAAAASLLG